MLHKRQRCWQQRKYISDRNKTFPFVCRKNNNSQLAKWPGNEERKKMSNNILDGQKQNPAQIRWWNLQKARNFEVIHCVIISFSNIEMQTHVQDDFSSVWIWSEVWLFFLQIEYPKWWNHTVNWNAFSWRKKSRPQTTDSYIFLYKKLGNDHLPTQKWRIARDSFLLSFIWNLYMEEWPPAIIEELRKIYRWS